MVTLIILIVILAYSGWTLYKSIKNKLNGQCDSSCSGCSLNGACPVKSMKVETTLNLSNNNLTYPNNKK